MKLAVVMALKITARVNVDCSRLVLPPRQTIRSSRWQSHERGHHADDCLADPARQLKDKARQCKILATTCDRSKRSTALIQSVNTGFGALLVFLICCAPGDTDGTHRLGVAADILAQGRSVRMV
jgi:hypothetical protein